MANPSGSFNHFGAIAAALPRVVDDMVQETAERILERAVAGAPRDTGRLAMSGEVIDAGGVRRVEFTAVDPSGRRADHEYPLYVEVGTVDTPAQPFLVPAVLDERSGFGEGLEDRLR